MAQGKKQDENVRPSHVDGWVQVKGTFYAELLEETRRKAQKQPDKVRIHLTVDNRELDTIIAALRLWQHSSANVWEIQHSELLAPAAVESLIERIN